MGPRDTGRWGEEQAARYLIRKEYKILERNFSCRLGEIDIIAKHGRFVVFTEVKLRKNADFAEAREFVTAAKQRRIISTALLWMQAQNCELQLRFDVIEIYAPDGENARTADIRHVEDAFET